MPGDISGYHTRVGGDATGTERTAAGDTVEYPNMPKTAFQKQRII